MATEFNYTREWTDAGAFPLLGFTRNWENPENYPTYEPDETKVRKDMQSLHDEVKDFLNNKLIPRVVAEDATVEAWTYAEEQRALAETGRADAETARVEAEEARAEAEAERNSAEEARALAEQQRVDSTNGIVAQATAQAEKAEEAVVDARAAAASASLSDTHARDAASAAGNECERATEMANRAATSANAAAASATAAASSETEARISEANAEVWAEGGTIQAHTGGMALQDVVPGAKGYAEQAAQSAAEAKQAADKTQGVQPDWNQNDSTAKDYVKNRPGGYYMTREPAITTQTITIAGGTASGIDGTIQSGKDYAVMWGRTTYYCTAYTTSSYPPKKIIGSLGENGFQISQTLTGTTVTVTTNQADGDYAFGFAEVAQIPVAFPEEFLPDSVKAQADWNQNDATQPDYVKNRPGGYTEEVLTSVYTTGDFGITVTSDLSPVAIDFPFSIVGKDYLVRMVTGQGEYTDYRVTSYSGANGPTIGTLGEEPFSICYFPAEDVTYFYAERGSYQFEVFEVSEQVVPIDVKYLPKGLDVLRVVFKLENPDGVYASLNEYFAARAGTNEDLLWPDYYFNGTKLDWTYEFFQELFSTHSADTLGLTARLELRNAENTAAIDSCTLELVTFVGQVSKYANATFKLYNRENDVTVCIKWIHDMNCFSISYVEPPAAMNAERWTFELSDGTVVEKDVVVG